MYSCFTQSRRTLALGVALATLLLTALAWASDQPTQPMAPSAPPADTGEAWAIIKGQPIENDSGQMEISGARPGLPYDGTNPHDTTCDLSARTIDPPMGTEQGILELRFSDGCQTAWARFVCTNPGCTNYDIMVERTPDYGIQVDGVRWPFSTPQGMVLYTFQLYDGGGYSAHACYRSDWTGWNWFCTVSY